MQITTTKANLVSPLSLVFGAADTKGTVPMLGTVLLKATDAGKLSFLCSDTGVLARALSPCDVKGVGEVAVDARRFNDLVRAVPDDKSPIEIKVSESVMQIKAGRSRFKLPTLDAKDYPRMIPEQTERVSITMDAARLASMVDDISLSMAVADIRIFMNGALFRIDEQGLWIVSTDGNRLVVSHEPIEALSAITPREVIVPRKTVLLAKKLLGSGQVKLTIGASDFQLSLPDGTVLLGKSIAGAFPDWKRVIPKTSFEFSVKADRLSDSLAMIAAMKVVDKEKKNNEAEKIELVIAENLLTIQKGDSARCEVDTVSQSADKAEININITYLADATAIMRGKVEDIRVGFSNTTTATTPITLRPSGSDYPVAVVMPMRG